MNILAKKSYLPSRGVVACFVIFVTIVLGVSVVGWHDQYTQKARRALERDFELMFGGPYPTNEKERLALRPLVLKELVARKVRLNAVEEETSRVWRQIYQDTGTKNNATMLTAALGEVERLESEKPKRQKGFWTACLIAFRAGFQNEAKVSRCEYERGGVAFM